MAKSYSGRTSSCRLFRFFVLRPFAPRRPAGADQANFLPTIRKHHHKQGARSTTTQKDEAFFADRAPRVCQDSAERIAKCCGRLLERYSMLRRDCVAPFGNPTRTPTPLYLSIRVFLSADDSPPPDPPDHGSLSSPGRPEIPAPPSCPICTVPPAWDSPRLLPQ